MHCVNGDNLYYVFQSLLHLKFYQVYEDWNNVLLPQAVGNMMPFLCLEGAALDFACIAFRNLDSRNDGKIFKKCFCLNASLIVVLYFVLCSGSTIVGIGSPDPPQFLYDDEAYKDVFLSGIFYASNKSSFQF